MCTIASKINVTPKGVNLPISKLHSILAVANFLPMITKVKFVTAVKFHYRVLQVTAVFLTLLGSTIYFAGDGTVQGGVKEFAGRTVRNGKTPMIPEVAIIS